MGDMASYPLDFLVGPGAVVDVSKHMEDWAVITPEMIESAPVEVKDGDILIISPASAPRRGDRVLVRTVAGEVLVRRLLRQTARRIDLQSLSIRAGNLSLSVEEIASVARIVWASQ